MNTMNGTRFMRKQSAAYQAALVELTALLEAEGWDSVSRAYAQAVSNALEQRWQQQHEVRLKDTSCCISHLLGKQCPIGRIYDCHDGEDGEREHECRPPATDHAKEGKRGRETVTYTSQPYGLDWKDLQAMVRYCWKHGLQLRIDATGSWHFPGRTLLVEYTRADRT